MKEKELNEERMLRNAIERSSMARGVPLHRRELHKSKKKIYDEVAEKLHRDKKVREKRRS